MMIKEDYRANNMSPSRLILGFLTVSPFYLVLTYRIANWLYRHKLKIIAEILMKSIGKIFFGADISPSIKVGPGLQIVHSVGVVIGGDTVIGANFRLHQNVTIGANKRNVNGRTMPAIGRNVTIYAGAVVVGPILIGDDVEIGANSVVTQDIPESVVVAGIPAKAIKIKNKNMLKASGD